jgi:hypothetical protein
MRWARHVAGMGEERKVYNVLVEKPEGKRSSSLCNFLHSPVASFLFAPNITSQTYIIKFLHKFYV